ncbi:RusA family crossover junction endodeoxyribonuclease [Halomonas rhizosphaerae]|uniref:Crossover junction endodeoxyribonuclease RusA n=1 Tax=Halomonas rhizosphaerae TaxID=3043296 RepID=A0ABT6UXB9_9GAMM|nr:RusA family crossover junction endodeoxyribonuclease [Halomonas rhizosphaerae]MDI5890623.1 RusA family crossover junction endodeoxyribonuclease [Halomonas rhizosphaerae]
MERMEVMMPWPPSTNSIWRNVGKRTLLSKEARVYRNRARGELLAQGACNTKLAGRVAVEVMLYPHNARAFDIDNKLKSLLDALTYSRVWLDDGQVDEILVRRAEEHRDGGQAVVTIKTIGGDAHGDGSTGDDKGGDDDA